MAFLMRALIWIAFHAAKAVFIFKDGKTLNRLMLMCFT